MSAERPWELRTWTSERLCPVCAVALFAAERDGYRVDACGKCGGSWLGHEDARRMIDTANKTPIDLAKMTDAIDPSSSLSLAEKQPGRACPDCRAALVRETILIEMMGSAGAGVEIDVCDAHGTWFDQRELQQVATHLIREYGPAARQAAADAEAAKQEPPLVDPRNIAIGVAALTIGLLGVAVGGAGVPRTETDFMGRRVEIDLQGRRIDAVTRLPIK